MKTRLLATSIFVVGSIAATSAFAANVTAIPGGSGSVDFANAVPMPLPQPSEAPAPLSTSGKTKASTATPRFVPGKVGDGKTTPASVPVSTATSTGGGVTPMQYGTANQPFTTSRADLFGQKTTNAYPYRAAGKLFFQSGKTTYVCSASLVARGIVATAAHCVANFGKSTYYKNWQFVPAYSKGAAPYGVWTVRTAMVLTSYFKGTDSCSTSGVVCEDDVALLELNAKNSDYPGTHTGWYGYALDGFGFTGKTVADGNLAQITELGYPVALDNGELMERTDSFGYTSAAMSFNTIIGSRQTGGSSGGPWLIDFGSQPAGTGSSGTLGAEFSANSIVGVTSWGYDKPAVKQQGASPLTSDNFGALYTAICKSPALTTTCH